MFDFLRKVKGYRTLTLATVTTIVGVLGAFGYVVEVSAVEGIIVAGFGLITAILRLDTDGPVPDAVIGKIPLKSKQ